MKNEQMTYVSIQVPECFYAEEVLHTDAVFHEQLDKVNTVLHQGGEHCIVQWNGLEGYKIFTKDINTCKRYFYN